MRFLILSAFVVCSACASPYLTPKAESTPAQAFRAAQLKRANDTAQRVAKAVGDGAARTVPGGKATVEEVVLFGDNLMSAIRVSMFVAAGHVADMYFTIRCEVDVEKCVVDGFVTRVDPEYKPPSSLSHKNEVSI
jgi:hypothetical protein